ncbi:MULTISPECIES: hypothetical protein [unclassified Streptomyces]|uniref:hypothetical protein n=1 Tax=unclassified Streptomyces TaxID=2593676 RepID=UPI001368F3CB|nr:MULTISPECIES: hypothetical protein [unclassified Streptomyces]MYZ19669.1 hypothetical protein [Streptomyces sp. SID337]NDZ92114.1 hypothetical protein [Streptomyces sp. SID10115]NDZ99434.1 hypothetical protein [Streptomyces sp. SID10116]
MRPLRTPTTAHGAPRHGRGEPPDTRSDALKGSGSGATSAPLHRRRRSARPGPDHRHAPRRHPGHPRHPCPARGHRPCRGARRLRLRDRRVQGRRLHEPGNGKRDRAEDIAVAAGIAAERPAAGHRLPPSRTTGRGGGTVELVVANLGPGPLEILHAGPATGTVKLENCASCRIYATGSRGDDACRTGVTKYPRTTLRLPAGTYHFLYKRAGVRNRADGVRLSPAYRYTDCSFVTRGTAGLGPT